MPEKNKKSTLSEWSDIIRQGAIDDRKERQDQAKSLGKPADVVKDKGYKMGIWKVDGGVYVTRITKAGPDVTYRRFFSSDFITAMYNVNWMP